MFGSTDLSAAAANNASNRAGFFGADDLAANAAACIAAIVRRKALARLVGFLPKLTNGDLARLFGATDDAVVARTGIAAIGGPKTIPIAIVVSAVFARFGDRASLKRAGDFSSTADASVAAIRGGPSTTIREGFSFVLTMLITGLLGAANQTVVTATNIATIFGRKAVATGICLASVNTLAQIGCTFLQRADGGTRAANTSIAVDVKRLTLLVLVLTDDTQNRATGFLGAGYLATGATAGVATIRCGKRGTGFVSDAVVFAALLNTVETFLKRVRSGPPARFVLAKNAALTKLLITNRLRPILTGRNHIAVIGTKISTAPAHKTGLALGFIDRHVRGKMRE